MKKYRDKLISKLLEHRYLYYITSSLYWGVFTWIGVRLFLVLVPFDEKTTFFPITMSDMFFLMWLLWCGFFIAFYTYEKRQKKKKNTSDNQDK